MRKLRHDEIPRRDAAAMAALPRHPITVVLDDVRSLYNVGSILRTSDAALVEEVVCCGITGTPDHRGIHKTALGAQDTVPWSYEEDPLRVVRRLRRAGHTVAVLEITDEPTPPRSVGAAHFPLCLVVGSEVRGVRDAVVAEADLALEIPQFGTKQSLNVAVAYGIAVFDVVRRYRHLRQIGT